MVDAIQNFWIRKKYTQNKEGLVIFADNGPKNSSRRTQFMKRIIEFSAKNDVKIILAYYPHYHSKYNPVERVWGDYILYKFFEIANSIIFRAQHQRDK